MLDNIKKATLFVQKYHLIIPYWWFNSNKKITNKTGGI